MNHDHEEPFDPRPDPQLGDPLDEKIRQALAGLPRERAAGDFTRQVLSRLDEIPRQKARWRESPLRFRWRPVLGGALVATAMVAALLAAGVLRPVGSGGVREGSAAEPRVSPGDAPSSTAVVSPKRTGPATASSPGRHREADALLAELRREHQGLKRELRELRELAQGSQVIYVGGDETLDFVLDLDSDPAPGGGPDFRPAALQRPGPGGGFRRF